MSRLTQAQIEAVLENGVDVKGRRVWLHGDVDESTIALAIRGLYLLGNESSSPIELFVTSYGGEIDEAFALHDVMRTIPCQIHTIALGKCQSAAPLIVASGKPGQRWAGPTTRFMMHDAMLDVPEGSPAFVKAQAVHLDATMSQMARLLGQYTKKPKRHWSGMFKSVDTFFGVYEAQKWGLIDHVWDEKG